MGLIPQRHRPQRFFCLTNCHCDDIVVCKQNNKVTLVFLHVFRLFEQKQTIDFEKNGQTLLAFKFINFICVNYYYYMSESCGVCDIMLTSRQLIHFFFTLYKILFVLISFCNYYILFYMQRVVCCSSYI